MGPRKKSLQPNNCDHCRTCPEPLVIYKHWFQFAAQFLVKDEFDFSIYETNQARSQMIKMLDLLWYRMAETTYDLR